MTATRNQCPKCTGQMEPGFMVDRSFSGDRFLRWVEGETETGAAGLKLVGRKTNEIGRTDKCGSCGYLEFYTSPEVQYV